MASILIVDDDPAVRDSVDAVLSLNGHDVRQAGNGRQCETAVGQRLPDLVILDIMMPEQEGIETIRSLRRHHPNLKILAISGGGDIQLAQTLHFAKEFGAHAALAKPFLTQDLLATVQSLVTT